MAADAVPVEAASVPDVTMASDAEPAVATAALQVDQPTLAELILPTLGVAPGFAAPPNGQTTDAPAGRPSGGCTTAQLRRFIKSRPYVPMHELRRRFAIDGTDDEVTALATESGRVFVGLPAREGLLLGDLVRQGDVGVELSLDPVSPVVVGVYPMRPVVRS